MVEFSKTFILKNGIEVLLRLPQKEDADALLVFANVISKEDTFITMSGETLTLDEEITYLNESIAEIEKGDKFQILGFVGKILVANASIARITKSRKRCLHVGEVAISIARDYRELGLGREILVNLIEGGKGMQLRLLTLTLFSINQKARSLYESAGFKLAGEIPEMIWYKGDYVGQTHMYLPLI